MSFYRRQIVSDAVVVLGMTASAYLFTFYHQSAYLDHFGINRTFVYIDIDRISSAGGYILAFLGGFVALVVWPKRVFVSVGNFLYNLFPGIFFITVTLALFVIYGVTWLFAVFFVASVPVFLYQLANVILGSKKSAERKVDCTIATEGKRFESMDTVLDFIFASPERKLIFICFSWVILIRFFGLLAGTMAAVSSQSYQVINSPQGSYAVITRNGESVIAVGVKEIQDLPKRYKMSGEVKFLEITELEDMSIRSEQARIRSQQSNLIKWQSWREFIERNASRWQGS